MQNRNHFRNCPLCNTPNPYLFIQATSPPPDIPSQIQVTEKYFGRHGDMVRCRNCNFVYIGKRLFVKKVTNLYKKMSDAAYIQEEKERRCSFAKIIKSIESLLKNKRGRILDIGCCTGALLSQAKSGGWKPYGIDPSIWACRMASKLHGLKIINGTLDTHKFTPGYFDAVTIVDVLEHIPDPKDLLLKIHKLMKNNAILCVVTPDFGSFTAKILGKKWWGIRLAHLSYFTRRDLSSVFEDVGFREVRANTYIRYFSLYYILVRLLPVLDRFPKINAILKKITIPLVFYDTFELYLRKKS